MNSKNIKEKNNKPSETLRIATFGVLLFMTFFLIQIFLPSYIVNNSPVCRQEAIVKEIIEISGTKAKVKLSDGSINIQKIEKYDNVDNRFKNYIKVNEPVCLEYKSFFDYFIAFIITS